MSEMRDPEMRDGDMPEKDTPDPSMQKDMPDPSMQKDMPDPSMRQRQMAEPEMIARTDPPMPKTFEPRPSQMEASRQTELWPEFRDFRDRFHQIEMEFIDEPKAAVEKAESLIEEAVEHMTRELRDHVERIHGNVTHDADTERLRVAMLSYREFMDSMGGRRVA